MKAYAVIGALVAGLMTSQTANAAGLQSQESISQQVARALAVAQANQRTFTQVNALDALERVNRRDPAEPRRELEDRVRMQRAQRLSRMANEGQCAQAIRIAWDEGDRAMAESLYNVCRNDRVRAE